MDFRNTLIILTSAGAEILAGQAEGRTPRRSLEVISGGAGSLPAGIPEPSR